MNAASITKLRPLVASGTLSPHNICVNATLWQRVTLKDKVFTYSSTKHCHANGNCIHAVCSQLIRSERIY